jgi:hypothetical protein
MGTVPFFAAIGWGQWFRYVSGASDATGALLVFVPCWTSCGALIITCTVGLGTILCFTMALYNSIFPLAMTLLAGNTGVASVESEFISRAGSVRELAIERQNITSTLLSGGSDVCSGTCSLRIFT